MNSGLEIIRVTDEADVEGLYPVIQGMVDTSEGTLDMARLIEIYRENVEDPSTLLACARNGQGPVGYIYVVLREGAKGLVCAVEQLYSTEPFIGKGLYALAEMWARSEGAISIRAIVSPSKAEAMARLFGHRIQGVVLAKDL